MNNKETKYNESGINKNTYDLLFKDENLPVPIKDTKKNDKILDEIAAFTTLRENNPYDKIKKKIYEVFFHMDFSKISYDEENKRYNYNCEDKVIEFEKFSDIINDKKLKKELLSGNRVGKCHYMALRLIQSFNNPVSILSGTYERHGKTHLHSVIELQSVKGDFYIIDGTLNLFMLKQTYMELTQFKKVETIKDIEFMQDEKDGTTQFMKDINFISKPYLTFREELKENLQKNKLMLQETKDEELDKRIEEIKKQREDFERE